MDEITQTARPLRDPVQTNAAVGCHLLGFLAFVIPIAHILAPLGLWLFERKGKPFVDEHGREAVNFQISFTLWTIIGSSIALALVWTVIVPIVAGLALLVLGLVWLVTMIVAARAASRGESYRYPWTLRLIH